MDSRVDIITISTPDLEAARRFFVDGLGWPITLYVPHEVLFVQVGHSRVVSYFVAEKMVADVGGEYAATAAPAGPTGIALAQVVASEDEVVRVLDQTAAAGATILKPPQRAEFGGFHGFFADPTGCHWEIASNPGWHVDGEGRVTIGPVDASPA